MQTNTKSKIRYPPCSVCIWYFNINSVYRRELVIESQWMLSMSWGYQRKLLIHLLMNCPNRFIFRIHFGNRPDSFDSVYSGIVEFTKLNYCKHIIPGTMIKFDKCIPGRIWWQIVCVNETRHVVRTSLQYLVLRTQKPATEMVY